MKPRLCRQDQHGRKQQGLVGKEGRPRGSSSAFAEEGKQEKGRAERGREGCSKPEKEKGKRREEETVRLLLPRRAVGQTLLEVWHLKCFSVRVWKKESLVLKALGSGFWIN